MSEEIKYKFEKGGHASYGVLTERDQELSHEDLMKVHFTPALQDLEETN